MFPGLSSDGRDGTLFGQRVSAEFVMVLIAKLGGRAEVNMWQELDALHAAGVRIAAQPKSNIAGPDIYHLVDRDGRPWPSAAPPADTPQLEDGVIEGEIIEVPETETAQDPLFGSIAALTSWLEGDRPRDAHSDAVFIVKLGEEAGEAAQAYIGMTGVNPRKGVTHTRDDLLGELADVVYAGVTAIQHFTQDAVETRRIVLDKMERLLARMPQEPQDEHDEAMQWRDTVTLDVLDQEEHRQDPQEGNHEASQ